VLLKITAEDAEAVVGPVNNMVDDATASTLKTISVVDF
jgi:hypothetical protein